MKGRRGGCLPVQVLSSTPTLLMGQLSWEQQKKSRNEPAGKCHQVGKTPTRDDGKGGKRSAWSKTTEGQIGLSSLELKSILVTGSLKVIASSCLRSMWSLPPNRVARLAAGVRTQLRQEIPGKLAESHAGTVLLLLQDLWRSPGHHHLRPRMSLGNGDSGRARLPVQCSVRLRAT